MGKNKLKIAIFLMLLPTLYNGTDNNFLSKLKNFKKIIELNWPKKWIMVLIGFKEPVL